MTTTVKDESSGLYLFLIFLFLELKLGLGWQDHVVTHQSH